MKDINKVLKEKVESFTFQHETSFVVKIYLIVSMYDIKNYMHKNIERYKKNENIV